MDRNITVSRRKALKGMAAWSLATPFAPSICTGAIGVSRPMKRMLGRIGFEATTFGLGGQAAIEKEPAGVDPVAIVVKALESGVNYFDTSNAYGPSQRTFGKAFRMMGLVPQTPNYRERRRRRIFLTSKTGLRLSKGQVTDPSVTEFSNGDKAAGAVGDVRRSLTQIFGDGKGNYPPGAYLDMVLIHAFQQRAQMDLIRLGLKDTHPDMERIGALAGLRDLRDGTNLTGLNPKEEKLIRHIGFSGHKSAPYMMELIRSDEENLFDGMLIAINANDRNYTNMQHNVIPVASAKNIGVIGMKVFAGGAMYARDQVRRDGSVIFSVGSERMPSRELMEYSLTTPGVDMVITGIGAIAEDSRECQLTQNLSAAQVGSHALSENDRQTIEQRANAVGREKDGMTNRFQWEELGLTAVTNLQLNPATVEGRDGVELTWDSAIAGDEPIREYNVFRNGVKVASIAHTPQTTSAPFRYTDTPNGGSNDYAVQTVDMAGNAVSSRILIA